MKVIVYVIFCCLVVSVALGHGGSRVQSDTYTIEQLAPDIYLLKGGRGGNVAFRVGERGVLVIDDQFAELAPEIKAAIESVTDKPIKYLVNTHHHGDHSGGNAFFKQYTEIVAHENVRRNLIALRSAETAIEDVATPTLTYRREVRIYLDGSEIQVFHLDHGHTNGDSVIYFPEQGVVHLGDLYFNGRHPFIDYRAGASTKGWIRFLETVLERVPSDADFIPGHGAVSDAEGLRQFANYLKELRAKVSEAVANGKTREQAMETIVLETAKGWPEERGRENIARVYDEIFREGTSE